ncbi:type II toxin-antitoxin system RelE/ParE family toxin [Mesorhizobium sp. WSM2239]|uniref:Type II toxin-antitoxin system RelE/ParE family toxin n=2 Tax=unclassified Mesorhizobium TaxID=325217 RepID=A0AAU8DCE1_9HYPH
MSGFRLSPSARADVREIWFDTSDTWSEAQADRYMAHIESTCAKLAAGELTGRSAGEFRKTILRSRWSLTSPSTNRGTGQAN